MRIAISLFITSLLFQVNVFAQDTTIVWNQVNNSNYSFKYPEHWVLKFEEDSKEGFRLEIREKSNTKKVVAIMGLIGTELREKVNPDTIFEKLASSNPDSTTVYYPKVSKHLLLKAAEENLELIDPLDTTVPLFTKHLISHGIRENNFGRYYFFEGWYKPGTDIRVTEGHEISYWWYTRDYSYRLVFKATEDTYYEYKPLVVLIAQSIEIKE